MKKYILIAGVNGAGKSTLFHVLDELKDMPRVNTDEIVKQYGDWNNISNVLKAGKQSVKMIEKYFSNNITFNQETTLCGNHILKNIRKAKVLGYYIELHYIGVESVDIAKKRVAHRVAVGGHGIPEKDIERRYVETFENLNKIISEFDRISFYDNTTEFERFAIIEGGKTVILVNAIPKWFEKVKRHEKSLFENNEKNEDNGK